VQILKPGLPRRLRWALLFPAALLLADYAAARPALVETLYSRGLYRLVGQTLSHLTGRFPFSVAEAMLAAIFFAASVRLGRVILHLIRRQPGGGREAASLAASAAAAAGVVYFSFIAVWGLNYYRLPFAASAGLVVRPAQTGELAALVADLTARANTLREGLSEDAAGAMHLTAGKADALRRAEAGFAAAAPDYPFLAGRYGRPKGVFLSRLMSYAGISGVYFPFTAEANVNLDTPASQFPATVCHEMAHQRGIAREDEANYIAYLVCTRHPDRDFRYSGVLLALLNAAGALKRYAPEEYEVRRAAYGPGIERDLAAIRAYRERYAGPVEEISERINDAYLRSNRQADGVASYGRMVDLLLAERRKNSQPGSDIY
jgi:hypothetical protein